jgi:hypothetical protein
MDPFIREMMGDQAATDELERLLTNSSLNLHESASLEPKLDAEEARALVILPDMIVMHQNAAHAPEEVTTLKVLEGHKTVTSIVESEHVFPDINSSNVHQIKSTTEQGVKQRDKRHKRAVQRNRSRQIELATRS